MKIKIILIGFLISFGVFAQGGFLKGSGRYAAEEGEKLSFIKQQLLYEATKEIITQELTSMKLDTALFWEKYQLKFDDYFISIEENLKIKYKVATEEDIASNKEYKKALRYKRLLLKSRFGRLGQVLSSFVVKRMSHSSKFTHVYHINILGKVNRTVLNKIYVKFTRQNSGKLFNTLYLRSNIRLLSLAWPDIGVEVVSDFKKVVNDYWSLWLTKKLDGVVEKVVITDEAIENSIDEYYQKDVKIENTQSEFAGSVALNASFEISKESKSLIFKKLGYKISGRLNAIELQTHKILFFIDLPEMEFSTSTDDNHELSSNVATNLYKYPLGSFETFYKSIISYNPNNNQVTVFVDGIKSVTDLFALKQKIENQGISLGLSGKINSYQVKQQTAELKLQMSTNLEKFSRLFRDLNQKELRDKLILNTSASEGRYNISFVYSEEPSITDDTVKTETEGKNE